jgi:hypothetical protein
VASQGGGGLRRPPVIDVGANVEVDSGADQTLAGFQNSPSLAVDPTDHQTVLVADRIDRPSFSCAVYRSTDGGRHWAAVPLPLPPQFDTCFAAQATFAADGTAYVSYLTLDTSSVNEPAGNTPDGGWLIRSTDHGAAFAAPVAVAPTDAFQLHVAVGASGRVYVLWLQADQNVLETPLGLGAPPNPILVSSSVDGGETFSAPVQVNPDGRRRVGAASLALDGRGDVFVLYEDYEGDLADYQNYAVPYDGTFTLMLARSSDGGRHFSQAVVDDAVVRVRPFLVYLPPVPSVAVDPSGRRVYVAWSDARSGAGDVLVRRSGDGGVTWSSPERLDLRSPAPADFVLPAVSVAADGRVDVVFLGQVQGRPGQLRDDVWYAYSADRGAHFSRPVRLTRASFDGRVGPTDPRDVGVVDEGTTLAVMSLPSGILAAWPDSRKGSPVSRRQDVYFARAALRS